MYATTHKEGLQLWFQWLNIQGIQYSIMYFILNHHLPDLKKAFINLISEHKLKYGAVN